MKTPIWMDTMQELDLDPLAIGCVLCFLRLGYLCKQCRRELPLPRSFTQAHRSAQCSYCMIILQVSQ